MKRLIVTGAIVSIVLAGTAEASSLNTGSDSGIHTANPQVSELAIENVPAAQVLDGVLTIASVLLAGGASLLFKKRKAKQDLVGCCAK